MRRTSSECGTSVTLYRGKPAVQAAAPFSPRPPPRPRYDLVEQGGAAMPEATVIRLSETKTVPFGPDSFYQLLVGDEAGNTPVRVGIQTAEPGYAAGMH